MDLRERIESRPDVLLGKPVIKGTRISIELILRKLSEGLSVDELIAAYPHLSRSDVFAALAYGADTLAGEERIAS